MSGIYLHIPFCRQACHYCDFHFSTSLKQSHTLINALCQEIQIRKGELPEQIKTIYFGGGTPSVLSLSELQKVKAALGEEIWAQAGELTLEANPEDLSMEKLQGLSAMGINRLSIGIQSFHPEYLKRMNRAHNAQEAIQSVRRAQDMGIENISVDLIYGQPWQSIEDLEMDMEQVLALDVPHISAYCLTIEPQTAFGRWLAKGQFPEADEDLVWAHYHKLCEGLAQAGFAHYEVSNFAHPGYQAQHNTSYWLGKAYLGLGPSAHSFDGQRIRKWNIKPNARYIKALEQGKPYWQEERLSKKDRKNEKIMIGLRTDKGLALEELHTDTEDHQPFIQKLLDQGMARQEAWESGRLSLSDKGLFFADGLAARFFH